MTEVITHELLKSWSPCTDGYKRFCELFPEGATLQAAIDGLVADDHDEWGYWLFNRCREKNLFTDFVSRGYRNAGYRNAGNWNAGNWNAGDMNAGDMNAGNRNAGNWNAGDMNAGNWNAGDMNAGNWNAGDMNAGDMNAGNRNAGYRNAGDMNAGNRNAGNWNAGDMNAGYFNTFLPDEKDIMVFNKPCKNSAWDDADKPNFLYFDQTEWVPDHRMTGQEKKDNPKFFVAEGYLKTISYKDAFKKSYDSANQSDKDKLLKLPNFDAKIFLEISGIDVGETK